MKSILNLINSKRDDLPVILLRQNVFFPNVTLWVNFDDSVSINAIYQSMLEGRLILFFCVNDLKSDNNGKISLENLYSIGTYAKIIQVVKVTETLIKILVNFQDRVIIKNFLKKKNYFRAKVDFISDKCEFNSELFTYSKFLREAYDTYKSYLSVNTLEDDESNNLFDSPAKLVDVIASNMNLEYKVKVELLQELDVKVRIEKLIINLSVETELLMLKKDIKTKVKTRLDKGQKEYFLNEQLKEIQKRLGRDENDYLERLNCKDIPEDIKPRIEKEISRLTRMNTNSPDANIVRNYVELLLDLPWNENTVMNNSLREIEFILKNAHYGMDKAKEKIMNFLAVYHINSKVQAPILCLVGPPGTGKTSVALSIAKSLSREFAKISLGGLRDETEIRGHRRSYVGALPGVFINAIKVAGKSNPVILLDEIDKINSTYKGNPESALLEVLDAEQNSKFVDHYLEIPYDLSNVLFVATANSLHEISRPLLDRMEIIKIEGYSCVEKLEIAKNFLIPKIIKESFLSKVYIKIEDDVVLHIIRNYTMESGVRSLKRVLTNLFRMVVRELLYVYSREDIIEGNFYFPSSLMHGNNSLFTHDPDIPGIYKIINMSNFHFYVDCEYKFNLIRIDSSGFVYGLAWTSYGGAVLPVEAIKFDRKGDIILTGSLGAVMKESAQLAYSVVKTYSSELNLDINEIPEIHLHFPEGATPKDGPSAGITIATAIASVLSDKKVPLDLAMTGEVTLKGSVLPVGGIKEKVLAAYRHGINRIIIPRDNEKDYIKLPEDIRDNINVKYVSHLGEVFDYLNII
ncbi:endopeptidase La [Borrelia hermsii]|nr:endopeptidase La [Borrelia hermsii]AJW73403.1 Lon protease [Borrelia hermsii CC1]AMR75242.1 ATP-dependent endopeptidase Lon [Borrelia hermsii]ANA43414.1 Lon protease [Borrelia hermsii HS1]UCP01617.1 endopeptidase La [Borrelia hermsii]UEQ07246.1 endopeptidase La [Borrelia hermsii]